MHKKIFFLLFVFWNLCCSAQSSTKITKEDIYGFMNEAIFNDGEKVKINPAVLMKQYDSIACWNEKDSNYYYGIECMMWEFRYWHDTLQYFLTDKDILFFEKQVRENTFLVWDDEKLSENVKVLNKNRILHSDFSFPLFSRDKKTVIIASGGLQRFNAYHWNELTKKWDWVDSFQRGT